MSDVLAYFGDLMRHEFTVQTYTGDDQFGNPQFELPAGPYRGRVDIMNQRRGAATIEPTQLGPQNQPDCIIICVPCYVHVRDKIVIRVPSGIENLEFAVYDVQQEFDEFNLHHLELSLRLERP